MISVIIPAINEEAHLPSTLEALRRQTAAHEVLVVDAQSTDRTCALAKHHGARVLRGGRPPRAAQMNAGVAATSGEILLFLHADTRLAEGALSALEAALRDPSVLGGGFARRYEPGSAFLRLTCALAELRTRWFGWFLGDQAMFVRRSAFEHLGGFPEWDAFEDLEFARRLARLGRVATLRPAVVSADRRFQRRGAVPTTWRDLCLTASYLFSSPPRPYRHAGDAPASTLPTP